MGGRRSNSVYLLPVNDTDFSGFVCVEGLEMPMQLRLPSTGKLHGATIDCDARLEEMLRPYTETIHDRLRQSRSVDEFLVELTDVLDRVSEACPRAELPAFRFYEGLVDELHELGWHRLTHVDRQMQSLTFGLCDGGGREHALELRLPFDYPSAPPSCGCALPEPVNLDWSINSRLADAIAAVEAALTRYQLLWDELDDIDEHTVVLEPAHPTRDIVSRRIAIGQHCSLHLSLTLSRPRAVPDIRLLGSESVLKPLRARLTAGLADWDEARGVRQSIERLLGLELPVRNAANADEFSAECAICYAYRLDSAAPDRTCDNAACARPFHRSCLLEWMRSLPSSRQSFHVLFGECPYCSEPLTLRLDGAS